MDYEKEPQISTDEWLLANGHSRQWLNRWLAEPELDKQAITDWLVMHRHSEPRLIPRKFLR